MENEQMYYVQQSGGYVGNSMLWWKHDNCGYVCDIREAKKFTKTEIDKMDTVRSGDKKAWPVEMVDKLVQHHIDMQDCRDGNYQPPKRKHAKHSEFDSDGKLRVACYECKRGGNGDGTDDCSSGWQAKKWNTQGCFVGKLLTGLLPKK